MLIPSFGVRTRAAFSAALFACALPAHSDVRYTVRPDPDTKKLTVEMQIPAHGPETLVQLPRWMPGFYMLQDSGTSVTDLAVSGRESTVVQVDGQTWKITSSKGKKITLSYKVPFEFADGMGHYMGCGAYLYVVGRTQERCHLKLDVPTGWKIAVGLDGRGSDFKAPTYDVLADNSVTMGNFVEATYRAAGKEHTIAVRGSGAAKIDMVALQKQCEFVSNAETDFMGGAPYNHYVWHFNVTPGRRGGSGLEHLSSTDISMGADLGPRMAGLFAHEFFHLWNVKRVRSRPLGPFDYTKLPKTGALWWLEGVTEYYAINLLGRYGWHNEREWLTELAGNVNRQGTNPQHLVVSPFESSYRVDESNNGRGNSNGYGLSYYDEGVVVGLCLDLELIAKTEGKHNLDEVEFALYEMCKNDRPGFEEDEIRKQLVKLGGESLGPYYDRVVMKPGDLPIAEALAYVGFELSTHMETEGRPKPVQVTEIKSVASPTPEQLRLRAIWLKTKKLP